MVMFSVIQLCQLHFLIPLKNYEGEFVINGLDGTAYYGSISTGSIYMHYMPFEDPNQTALEFIIYNVKSLKTEQIKM